MPACFDLCAGGFLRPAAHAGSIVVAVADIVQRGFLRSQLGKVGNAMKSGGEVEVENSEARKVMSSLASSLALLGKPACSRASGTVMVPRCPTRRAVVELVQFSGARPTLGFRSPKSPGFPLLNL